MHAIALRPCDFAETTPAPLHAERTLAIINHLRVVARRSRSMARIDLEHACALLLANPADADMRHAETLMRGFKQAIDKRPVFHTPGTVELSFDEAWLGRLFETIEAGDEDSFWFLIRSRVPRWTQRHLAYLVKSISKNFHQI